MGNDYKKWVCWFVVCMIGGWVFDLMLVNIKLGIIDRFCKDFNG